MRISVIVILGALVCACNTAVPPTGQSASPLQSTRIEPGIYSGAVECEFEYHVSGVGLVDSSTSGFSQTLSFDENGLPATGVNYDPDDDHIDVLGIRFDVVNRTVSSSSDGLVEDASLVASHDGIAINGIVTWTFTYGGSGMVNFRTDFSVSYRRDGIGTSERETCHGVLQRPQ